VAYVAVLTNAGALELLKLLQVDLLVATAADPMPLMLFAARMRKVSPWQRWLLTGPDLTDQDEVTARCNGALAVIDCPGDWSEIQAIAARVGRRTRELVAANV
jgi:hypothetical protein